MFILRKKEKSIIISSWLVTSILLLKFIPLRKSRIAIVSFLFIQFLTWLFGLVVVEKRLIKYPFRMFFKKANKASFTFEFFIFPVVGALFNANYPEGKGIPRQLLHYLSFTAVLTGLEIYAVRKTKTITYLNWRWYYSFCLMWLCFYLSHLYQKWFLKGENSDAH